MQLCYNSLPNCHLSCREGPGAHMHRHTACTCTYHRDNHPIKIFNIFSIQILLVRVLSFAAQPAACRIHLARTLHLTPRDAFIPSPKTLCPRRRCTHTLTCTHIFIYIYIYSSLFMQRKKKMKRRRGHHTSSASWACGFFYNPH